jgi:hypothetical protein
MITVNDFRRRILDRELDWLVDEVLLAGPAAHVEAPEIAYIRASLAAKFGVLAQDVSVWVVGSAKLGFSINEKHLPNGAVLPRYRAFSAASDIDVAVVSPRVFDLIWKDLSTYAHRVARLPWDSGRLGDYLVYGWLRPDHFPIRARLRRCDDWWDLFRALSSHARYGRRKVRGGLFYSGEQMRQYLMRALNECAATETLEI